MTKLTTLAEISKQADSMPTPELQALQLAFDNLKFAIQLKDKEGIKRYGVLLAARVVRVVGKE